MERSCHRSKISGLETPRLVLRSAAARGPRCIDRDEGRRAGRAVHRQASWPGRYAGGQLIDDESARGTRRDSPLFSVIEKRRADGIGRLGPVGAGRGGPAMRSDGQLVRDRLGPMATPARGRLPRPTGQFRHASGLVETSSTSIWRPTTSASQRGGFPPGRQKGKKTPFPDPGISAAGKLPPPFTGTSPPSRTSGGQTREEWRHQEEPG
jgi:hypothetical protein